MMRPYNSTWLATSNLNWLTVGLPFAVILCLIISKTTPSKATRLIIASQTGQKEMVEKLLGRGVDPNSVNGTSSPLITAIRGQRITVVKTLLSHGADANFDAGTGITPLTWAVKTGNLELVRSLLQSGANADRSNADGTTAVKEAQKFPEILQALPSKP
jgi:ankyrin repeat protein